MEITLNGDDLRLIADAVDDALDALLGLNVCGWRCALAR